MPGPASTRVAARYAEVRAQLGTLARYNVLQNNGHIQIGSESYMLSGDGNLMPTKKGQKPPDLRYFTGAGK